MADRLESRSKDKIDGKTREGERRKVKPLALAHI